MKSAYELAMSRLEQQSPTGKKITEAQKRELAEIDSEFAAKIAERQIFLETEIAQADFSEAEQLRTQLALEIRRLEDAREQKKEQARKDSNSQ